VTPKLFKATEVCELTGLQPYVLRSWEKEFPGIGVQKSAESPRLYRQSDVEQVQRIKQLVFSEGLTLSGVRRRIEDERPAPERAAESETEIAEVLGADARARIANVRDGLRSILALLSRNGDGHHEHVGRVPQSQTVKRGGPAVSVPKASRSSSAKVRAKANRAHKRGASARKAVPKRKRYGM
jgi:DNA-binding transcriptional MerR regulator